MWRLSHTVLKEVVTTLQYQPLGRSPPNMTTWPGRRILYPLFWREMTPVSPTTEFLHNH